MTPAFRFGAKSRAELAGVHPDLVVVATRALALCEQDFAVHDGIRSTAEQQELVSTGASRAMASRHLVGNDGFGHAVDLVPVIAGKLRWEWPAIYPIAEAMRAAAIELATPIRWGGFWARLDLATEAPSVLVKRYVDVRRAQGKDAFVDGAHFELPAGGLQYR